MRNKAVRTYQRWLRQGTVETSYARTFVYGDYSIRIAGCDSNEIGDIIVRLNAMPEQQQTARIERMIRHKHPFAKRFTRRVKLL
ncbi:MAG: hypothetical protein LBT46_01870 [Planctomycetaceae bacterium]|jgi:hypothetical protein|nr:hypothetical protein [Planctomycetaceae bacterium]